VPNDGREGRRERAVLNAKIGVAERASSDFDEHLVWLRIVQLIPQRG
jgi:hypothetical protein